MIGRIEEVRIEISKGRKKKSGIQKQYPQFNWGKKNKPSDKFMKLEFISMAIALSLNAFYV